MFVRSRLPVLSLVLLLWPAVASANPVSLAAEAEAARPGSTISVTLTSTAPVFIAGCYPVHLQLFEEIDLRVDESDYVVESSPESRWRTVLAEDCVSEGAVQRLEPGSHAFELPITLGGMHRPSVTYGVGCTEGLPLSQARCSSYETVNGSSFQVN